MWVVVPLWLICWRMVVWVTWFLVIFFIGMVEVSELGWILIFIILVLESGVVLILHTWHAIVGLMTIPTWTHLSITNSISLQSIPLWKHLTLVSITMTYVGICIAIVPLWAPLVIWILPWDNFIFILHIEEVNPFLSFNCGISISINSSDYCKKIQIIVVLSMTSKITSEIDWVNNSCHFFVHPTECYFAVWFVSEKFAFFCINSFLEFDFCFENNCDTFGNISWKNIKFLNSLMRSIKSDISQNIILAWKKDLRELIVL